MTFTLNIWGPLASNAWLKEGNEFMYWNRVTRYWQLTLLNLYPKALGKFFRHLRCSGGSMAQSLGITSSSRTLFTGTKGDLSTLNNSLSQACSKLQVSQEEEVNCQLKPAFADMSVFTATVVCPLQTYIGLDPENEVRILSLIPQRP